MNPQERKDAVNVALGESLWGLGLGLGAPLTVFPLLLTQLGAGPLELGVFTGLATAGLLLTQPLGILFFSHGGSHKRFLITYHAWVSVPCFLAMAAVIQFLGARPGEEAVARRLVIALYGLHVLAIGVIVSPWQDWVAGLFTTGSRGRAYGMWVAAWSLALSAAALIAAKVRRDVGFPANYALLVALSVAAYGLSLIQYSRVSPGPTPSEGRNRPPFKELLALFGHSLREKNYRRYVIGRVLLTLGAGSSGFMAVHFQGAEGGSLSAPLVIGLGAFLTLPQAAGGYLLGVIGDRSGHRRGVLLGATAQAAAIAIAFYGRGWLACALCFTCLGLATAEAMVSHQNMIFETCPHDRRLVHITLSSLLLGPFAAAVFPATGWVIERAGGTGAGIGLCVVPTALGVLWLLLMVRDPREIVLGGELAATRSEGSARGPGGTP